jgi:hypothetical protein
VPSAMVFATSPAWAARGYRVRHGWLLDEYAL